MKRKYFIFYLICLTTPLFSQVSSLENSLIYLSSDSLKGRANGSPESFECALWIADQFKEIGLNAPSFTDNYLQKIPLIKARNTYKSLILNDLSIDETKFFTLGQFEKINVRSDLEFKLFIIGEKDDFSEIFKAIQVYSASYAVFIHPIHKKRFDRLMRYFTESNFELDRNNDSFSLWALTDASSIDNIQLTSINKLERKFIYNVIGELAVKNGEDRKWIFSAHYDHIGIVDPVNGDSIANGANDDASGVAGVIELAQKFKQGPPVEKSIYFVAFAGEELGLFGSNYLANTISSDSIEAVLCFELIGKANDDLGSESIYITGYDLSYLPDQMAKHVKDGNFMIFPDPYPQLNLFSRSDNAPFAAKGIAAHSISSYSLSDESYHSVNDEVELIDIGHLQLVIDEVYKSCLPLLQLDFDPGKIDYKTKNNR